MWKYTENIKNINSSVYGKQKKTAKRLINNNYNV